MDGKRQKKEDFFTYNFFLRKNHRGLSAVVTTLLIILLAIVAIGAVWVVISGIISEGSEEISLGRFTLDISIDIAYVDSIDSSIKVEVRRNSGAGELTNIRFIFFDGVDSIIVTKEAPLKELEKQTFSFTSEEIGDIGEGDSVSIAPIFETGSGNERVGAVTDTEQIGEALGGGISECNDGFDNDGDGDADLDDAGCDNNPNDVDETNCGDNVCEGGESFETCSLDCSPDVPLSCDGIWSSPDPPEDAGVECDGTSPVQGCDLEMCLCEKGFTTNGLGGCDLNPPLNSGEVLSIWPDPLAVVFFDSPNLTTNPSEFPSYGGSSILFSNGVCTTIGYLQYVVETGRSYVQLLDNSIIVPGETYEIWEADICVGP